MGQYHNVVNLDKNFFYSPRSLGDFHKLLEQGCSLLSCASLALLLSKGWNGERVALVGDYGEDNDLPGRTKEEMVSLYKGSGMRNVGWLARNIITDNTGVTFNKVKRSIRSYDGSVVKTHHYEHSPMDKVKGIDNKNSLRIVNFDKEESLNPLHFDHGDSLRDLVLDGYKDGAMTALFILLAVTTKNGDRGGGDSNHALNGTWGGDHIGIVPVEQCEWSTDISDKFDVVNGFYE